MNPNTLQLVKMGVNFLSVISVISVSYAVISVSKKGPVVHDLTEEFHDCMKTLHVIHATLQAENKKSEEEALARVALSQLRHEIREPPIEDEKEV